MRYFVANRVQALVTSKFNIPIFGRVFSAYYLWGTGLDFLPKSNYKLQAQLYIPCPPPAAHTCKCKLVSNPKPRQRDFEGLERDWSEWLRLCCQW